MKTQQIGIVGAGAAGIMAALEAVQRGARVLLLDANMIVGRKIHVTGNGRCNISNANTAPRYYTCDDPQFLQMAFALYGHAETVARLDEFGIPIYAMPDGWCYPVSNSAATVAASLEAMLAINGVDVQLQRKVDDIRQTKGHWVISTGGGSQTHHVDRVIVACGGKAYPVLGSTGELFPLLESLGHTVAPILPAMAPIMADVSHIHELQGVRLDVGLALFHGRRKLAETTGNMMFTQFGFSGPAAMDLSHWASARAGAALRAVIDLVPYDKAQLSGVVDRFRSAPVPLSVVLGSVMLPKIPPVLIHRAKLPVEIRMSELTEEQLERVIHLASHLEADVTGTRGFKFSQLSTGGIPVSEVDPETMESRIVSGLHFAGEVMDVIGPCGGFNLQWAWTSGAIAGMGAAG